MLHVHTFTQRERVAIESGWTLALVATGHVLADSVETAGRVVVRSATLVDVFTCASRRVSRVAAWADANVLTRVVILHTHLGSWARKLRPT